MSERDSQLDTPDDAVSTGHNRRPMGKEMSGRKLLPFGSMFGDIDGDDDDNERAIYRCRSEITDDELGPMIDVPKPIRKPDDPWED